MTADKSLKINLAMVLATPGSTATPQGNDGGSPPLDAAMATWQHSRQEPEIAANIAAGSENSLGDGGGGEEGVIRIAENGGAESAGTENAARRDHARKSRHLHERGQLFPPWAAGWVTWPLPGKAVAAGGECAVEGWDFGGGGGGVWRRRR